MTRDLILPKLYGRLRHTTTPENFDSILRAGAISPDPGFQNWRAVGGEECCSYARKLGGVSLFDFDQFEPDTYEQLYPLSSWHVFVPYLDRWGRAVWIEIDREKIAPNLISRSDLVTRWTSDKAYRHNFLPAIEAVHVGPLTKDAFKGAFLVSKDDEEFHLLM